MQPVLVGLAVPRLRRHERQRAVGLDRGAEIAEDAVDRRPEGALGQARADVGRDLGGGGGGVVLAFAPVGKRDARHGGAPDR